VQFLTDPANLLLDFPRGRIKLQLDFPNPSLQEYLWMGFGMVFELSG
jgi:hypothetical protein